MNNNKLFLLLFFSKKKFILVAEEKRAEATKKSCKDINIKIGRRLHQFLHRLGYIQKPLLMTVQYTCLYCRRFQALLRMKQKRCQRFSLHRLLSFAASVKRKYQKEKLCIRRRNHPNCSAHCRVFLKATHTSSLSSSSATTAFSKSSKFYSLLPENPSDCVFQS